MIENEQQMSLPEAIRIGKQWQEYRAGIIEDMPSPRVLTLVLATLIIFAETELNDNGMAHK